MKTVAKWKQSETVADLPTGPKRATSTLLSIQEEAIIVVFRRHTLLSLDDCLYLQPTIPHLTRSSLHRCLKRTAEGKLYLYVAIDRTSKFAFVQLVRKTGRTSAAAFLEALIAAVPYKIHTVLTDNGIQFTFPPRYADGPTARYATHMFDLDLFIACVLEIIASFASRCGAGGPTNSLSPRSYPHDLWESHFACRPPRKAATGDTSCCRWDPGSWRG
jgi:hypothetical protein